MSTTSADLSQPDTAAEQTTSDYSAFLGPPSHEPDLSVDESPAPSTEEEGQEPAAPAEPPAEGEEGAESEQPEEQPEPAEEEAEQPPSITERLKDLTARETEEYAARYPTAWKMLEDPKTPEDLKHLLLDKIDSDHEIQQRLYQEQQYAQQEEPTPEPVEEQPEMQAAPAAMTPVQQREMYYAQIDNLVKTQFDQTSVREFGDAMLRMFNVNAGALNDPNVSPEDKQVLQGLVQSVQREAPVLARYMADTVSTVIPHVLPAALELVMPGFGKTYERQQYGTAWESVRQQTDAEGRPLYKGLPAYPMISGTPEANAFAERLRDAAEQIPGFDDMLFRGSDGRVLPMAQQATMKYQMLARIMAGQRVNPAVVAEAVATGRRLASQADRRREAGRALGAGQSTNSNPVARGASAEEEDPMMAALDAEIARQEGSYRQPIRGRRSGR